jgi:hypothetical protein
MPSIGVPPAGSRNAELGGLGEAPPHQTARRAEDPSVDELVVVHRFSLGSRRGAPAAGPFAQTTCVSLLDPQTAVASAAGSSRYGRVTVPPGGQARPPSTRMLPTAHAHDARSASPNRRLLA